MASPQRRISGLSPAFADGILVCPTGAGAVVGVDLARRVLLWGYEYAGGLGSTIDVNNPGFFFGNSSLAMNNQPRWLDAVPHIADGAVFLTPMDSDEVHCLDLMTGNVRWKHPREALLYLAAVHGGKAVFAGRNSLLALDAHTGETVWEQPLGEMPAGRGVQSGDLYHMPLLSGEVATIRLSNHQELARSPVGSGLVPGNLIAVQGRLLSLSTDAIVGFERSTERDDTRRDAAALDRPAASDELALQGMRALHRGDVENGLSLLRRAATEGDSSEAKRSYVHVLLGGLRADFAAYRKYEQDLRQIIDDPNQKATFYRLLADGLNAAGDAPGAYEALLDLAASDVAGPEHVFAGSDRLVRSDRLDRARLEKMLEDASNSDRATMQAHARSAVQHAVESRDAECLERLVAILETAEPRTAALETLESIYNESGEFRKLERVRMELGAPTTVEPRDTPLARRFDVPWQAEYVPAEIKSVRKDSPTDASFSVPIIGSVPEFCKGWQFALSENAQTLVARDAFGQERWRLPLDRDRTNAGADPFGGRPASPGRAHVRFSGHLLAVLVGKRVLMLDLLSEAESPPVLWTADLSERTYSMVFINRRVMHEPADGPMAFAGSRLFLYEGDGALNAVDPLTGELFWRRIGFPDDCELSGDDEFVTVQLPGGGDVFVIDAADGRIVAQRAIPQPFQRLGWFGTQMVTARRQQQAIEITSEDLARETKRWSLRFPEASLIAQCGSNEIAVLEPAAGRLQLIDSADGSIVLEAKLEPDAAVADVAVTRHFERVVVLTKREEPAGLIRVETDRTRSPVNGLAYGFDDHGNRIWSAAIRQQYADLQQPPGLPVLALTATRIGFQGQRTHHVAVLDVRNGHLLIEQRRLSEFEPIAINVDSDLPSISIDCQGAKFLLTRSETPLPAPKNDGLAEFAALARELPVTQP
jgi:outer membrane protein assembly factor BamB